MFDKLRNLVLEDDTGGGAPPVAPGPSAAPAAPVVPAVATATTVIDPQVLEVVKRNVHDAAVPGLTAFEAQCTALQGAVPDEATRMRAALATLPTGLTRAQVEIDIGEVKDILTRRLEDARKSAAVKIGEVEAQRERELVAIDQRIMGLTAELEALRSKRNETVAGAGTLIADAKTKLAQFETATQVERVKVEEIERKLAAIK